nr:AtpZ/AtpI family protein [uncultured Sphingomonas sp.]
MADEKFEDGAKLPEDPRLESLDERLQRAQERETTRVGKVSKSDDDSERQGNKVISLLLGGIFGGTLLGWLVDGWFNTGHTLMIVGMVLGTTGAFYSIVKMAAPKR